MLLTLLTLLRCTVAFEGRRKVRKWGFGQHCGPTCTQGGLLKRRLTLLLLTRLLAVACRSKRASTGEKGGSASAGCAGQKAASWLYRSRSSSVGAPDVILYITGFLPKPPRYSHTSVLGCTCSESVRLRRTHLVAPAEAGHSQLTREPDQGKHLAPPAGLEEEHRTAPAEGALHTTVGLHREGRRLQRAQRWPLPSWMPICVQRRWRW